MSVLVSHLMATSGLVLESGGNEDAAIAALKAQVPEMAFWLFQLR